MAKLQANRTLSGSFAEVWVDGARIAELSELTLKVKLQREKVQLGMDVDSKITGYSGEGTMTIKQVYTRFFEVLEQAKGGVDKRVLAMGPKAIDEMVDRIFPVMKKRGGYIPTCDHGVPEEVSLKNYMHYRKRCLEFA